MDHERAAQVVYRNLKRVPRFVGSDVLVRLPDFLSGLKPDEYLGRYTHGGCVIEFFADRIRMAEADGPWSTIMYREIVSVEPIGWSSASLPLPQGTCPVKIITGDGALMVLRLWSDGRFTDASTVAKVLTRIHLDGNCRNDSGF